MKPMNDPDFVYQPWSKERRDRAVKAAAIRLYGSEAKARKKRAEKLRRLLDRRTRLMAELGRLESSIRYWTKRLIKEEQ